jgi:hypothetical protein
LPARVLDGTGLLAEVAAHLVDGVCRILTASPRRV